MFLRFNITSAELGPDIEKLSSGDDQLQCWVVSVQSGLETCLRKGRLQFENDLESKL